MNVIAGNSDKLFVVGVDKHRDNDIRNSSQSKGDNANHIKR